MVYFAFGFGFELILKSMASGFIWFYLAN